MNHNGKIKIIVTVGPSTATENDLKKIKDRRVDFIRVNMSHSSLDDLKYFIDLAKKVGLPFILDTEGSQIRTGELERDKIEYKEGDLVKIYNKKIIGNRECIYLQPYIVVSKLHVGDLIFLDFDTLVLKVVNISTINKDYICAKVMTNGILGNNKSANIISGIKKRFELPVLTEKDRQSIEIGLRENLRHIAVSFVKKGSDIDHVRKITKNSMYIISKIETKDSLENIDEIIDRTDAILIDRGDMSKEISVEHVPFVQKSIIKNAKRRKKPVYVATNLLETMVYNMKPTRAEVNDVINTILDGADGLILSAETAIGKYPIGCINMMNRLVRTSGIIKQAMSDKKISYIEKDSLVEPHGGKLIERIMGEEYKRDLDSLLKIALTEEQQMDLEQIAVGTYSPLEGFMCRADFDAVIDNMRLKSGIIWSLPIVLDVADECAEKVKIGDDVCLTDKKGQVIGVLHIEDKYSFDKKCTALKLYSTEDENHPGVKMVLNMKPVLLGGKIDLLKRRESEFSEYELTPRQVRRLFEDRNWSKIVGFHTRNVIHRAHEFIQLSAVEKESCDGLFVHPVVGKKKSGDFDAKYIIKAYEKMVQDIYPKNSVVLAVLPIFSRYAGPREAIFTALCRKNFGCSHFIVGRDHTGVGSYYLANDSHRIFDRFPDLGIKIIKFDNIYYSHKLKQYVQDGDSDMVEDLDKEKISGELIRGILKSLKMPPEYLMRPEISSIILDALKNNERVLVE